MTKVSQIRSPRTALLAALKAVKAHLHPDFWDIEEAATMMESLQDANGGEGVRDGPAFYSRMGKVFQELQSGNPEAGETLLDMCISDLEEPDKSKETAPNYLPPVRNGFDAYPRQAIETISKEPSHTKGARVLARCAAKSRTYGQGYLEGLLEGAGISVSDEHSHIMAARLLALEMEWSGKNNDFSNMKQGVIKNGNYVHVFVE